MSDSTHPFTLSKEQSKKKLRVGVAIDGSGVSEKALLLGGRLLHPDRRDRIYILHVSDPNKPWLPDTLTPDHLEHEYQLKCHDQQLDAVWYKKEKSKGQSTCEALIELTEELQVDILVVGSFGRKGERIDMLGTVSDFSLRAGNSDVCIVKSSSYALQNSVTWLFSTDDSHCAKAAFAALLYQILKPGDKLHVVWVTTEGGDFDNADLQSYKDAMKAAKVEGTCFLSGTKAGEPIADGILAVANKMDVDILVMGIAGYGAAKLGSVSAECCLKARCTTLVIKDPYEVKEKRAIASY
ncbi:hypothetical protein WJX79_008291 [Trebouxia sp. C0005]